MKTPPDPDLGLLIAGLILVGGAATIALVVIVRAGG